MRDLSANAEPSSARFSIWGVGASGPRYGRPQYPSGNHSPVVPSLVEGKFLHSKEAAGASRAGGLCSQDTGRQAAGALQARKNMAEHAAERPTGTKRSAHATARRVVLFGAPTLPSGSEQRVLLSGCRGEASGNAGGRPSAQLTRAELLPLAQMIARDLLRRGREDGYDSVMPLD